MRAFTKIVNSREILFKITFNIHFREKKKLDISHLDKTERNDSKILCDLYTRLKNVCDAFKVIDKISSWHLSI